MAQLPLTEDVVGMVIPDAMTHMTTDLPTVAEAAVADTVIEVTAAQEASLAAIVSR